MSNAQTQTDWLMLVYQFPQGPGSVRVKVWRRLQALGAIAVKHSMYVLPPSEQAREDFQWLLAELREAGAEAIILEARFLDGLNDAQIRAQFNAARDADYDALSAELEAGLAQALDPAAEPEVFTQATRRLLVRTRRRLAEIAAIDFFGAGSRAAVESALRALAQHLALQGSVAAKGARMPPNSPAPTFRDRVWVTRCDVGIDRIASAWLIRRFVDPQARFRFIAGQVHGRGDNEIRFDMFDAEFTHRGDRCTFEVLANELCPQDEALRSVGEIVHDIDLKDAKFQRAEAAGIAGLIAGIVLSCAEDSERLQRGYEIFEGLYRFFGEPGE